MSDPDQNPADAPFQSLYRRFRPQRFSEVRGQSHVTLALRNAVRDGRVAHAYLFSGPRGTGKTSTARILGKALNCTDLVDGEPCGVCDSCRSIASGNSFDVHELDAASNNGVEAMRDSVARSNLATPGRWKVYIVDEVHMLSTPASNALLKTLEEPPDHVVFVLATTDPQKILPTIRSRTQQYEFHLMTDDVLAELVGDVVSDAGLRLPDGAAAQAVRRGRGSARDTLSVLDQVAAAGVVDDDTGDLANVISAIAAEDATGALTALDGSVRQGRDPQQIAVDLVELLRTGFLSLAGASSIAEGIARVSPDELETLRSLGLARCVRAMELIGTAIVSMREAPEPRITLEVAVFRAASASTDTSVDALVERIERLERRIDSLGASAAPPASPPPPPRRVSTSGPVSAATPAGDMPSSGGRPALGAFRQRTGARPEHEAPETAPTQTAPTQTAPTQTPPIQSATTHSEPEEPQGPETGEPPTATAHESAPDQPEPTLEAASPEAVAPSASSGRPEELPPIERREVREPPAPAAAMPDRDAFVLAWGDSVLTSLRPRTRMLYNVGHFVAADGGVADFALPNAFHIQMAEPHREEVTAALSQHLGIAVEIRLVLETGAKGPGPRGEPGREPPATPPEPGDGSVAAVADDFDDEIEDSLDATDDASGNGTDWATNRIREAFPGTEEVES